MVTSVTHSEVPLYQQGHPHPEQGPEEDQRVVKDGAARLGERFAAAPPTSIDRWLDGQGQCEPQRLLGRRAPGARRPTS